MKYTCASITLLQETSAFGVTLATSSNNSLSDLSMGKTELSPAFSRLQNTIFSKLSLKNKTNQEKKKI
jgi:hypothetical protein